MQNTFTLTAADLCKKLDDSQDFMDKVTSGFAERNERIFYRDPVQNSSGKMEYAELVDNTLASYLEKMPKNVIQRLATFTADARNFNKAEDLAIEYVASKIILQNGNSKGYSLLQKQWIEMRNAATFGACAVYLPFELVDGEYTVGEVPIYWGDLYPEAYAANINSANFVTFRTLKTEDDLKAIQAGLDEEVGSTWVDGAIEKVFEYGKGQNSGKKRNTNYKAQMVGLPDNMYELFVYTDRNWVVYFHYASQTILRIIPNLSGRRRVVGLYSDYDGSSIMGRSMVDMAYGIQQTMTALLRNFIYTSDYNTDPAKFVKGINLDEERFNLTKGNTMFLGDEDGNVQLLPIDTTTLQQFPSLYNLMKTVLLTSLPSSNDSSISASTGDPTYSKTQAGVNSQDQKADIEHNYYRKNYEAYSEMALENKVNIWLSEVKAIAAANDAHPIITIYDDEYAKLIREQDPDMVFMNAQNQIRLDFTDNKPVNISVNFESTRQLAKEEDLKRLNTFMTGFFEAAKSDPGMAKVMRSVMPLLMEEMTKSSNLDNSTKIAETMKQALNEARQEEQQMAQQEAQNAQSGQGGQGESAMAEIKPPTVSIAFKDLPPSGKIQAAADYGIHLTEDDVSLQRVIEEEKRALVSRANDGGSVDGGQSGQQ